MRFILIVLLSYLNFRNMDYLKKSLENLNIKVNKNVVMQSIFSNLIILLISIIIIFII